MRASLLPLLLVLTACASGPHVYADEQGPAGIPKSARAHCRSWAPEVAKEAPQQGLNDAVATCLDALLRANCAEELAREAEQLERARKGEDPFYFRFPGAWEPDEVHEQVMEIAQSVCSPSGKAMIQAVTLLHAIRNARGGRIPWASFGAPRPGAGMCREGCPAK